jgi:lysophospholipase L1-like esterase
MSVILGLAGLAPAEAAQIPADHTGIRYSGRFDFADPKGPRFDWPGTSIQARFTGPSVTVRLSGGDNDFNAYVDGAFKTRIALEAGKTEYEVATGLPAGEHALLLTKRTEASSGIVTFQGLVLADGHGLVEPPPRPAHRILFVGDSFTVGYGADATTTSCSSLRPWDNNDAAYSSVTAKALGAEYSIQAISGKGMVHNYGDAAPLSQEPMPFFFDRTLAGSAQPDWNFPSWIPHAVVVALGTNDFSTAVKPSREQYASAYKAFLQRLRGHFPSAVIVCVTFASDNLQGPYVDALVKEVNAAGDDKVHRVGMPGLTNAELGCDWHPNVAGHKKFSDILVPALRPHLSATGLAPRLGGERTGARKARQGETPFLFHAGDDSWSDARGRLLPGP